jgi:hypothetical protein
MRANHRVPGVLVTGKKLGRAMKVNPGGSVMPGGSVIPGGAVVLVPDGTDGIRVLETERRPKYKR